ncbi:MAG: sulfite exporter TauE/SafE family protein [bacterium]
MHRFLLIVVIGSFAQYIDGALGMGYGVSSSAFLIAAGLMPALVSASVHTAELFTSLVSGLSHLRFGNVDKKISIPLTFAGIAGGVAGAYIVSVVPGETMKPFVGIILLFLGIKIFVNFFGNGKVTLTGGGFSRRFLVILGIAGGTVDAVGGGGWGPICTSTLVAANKTEPRYIIGSVNLSEFFTTAAIVLTFGLTLGFDKFLWHITIPLIIGGIIAAPLAAYTSRKISPATLGTAVGVILILLSTRTIASFSHKMFGFWISFNPVLTAITIVLILTTIVIFKKAVFRKIRSEVD